MGPLWFLKRHANDVKNIFIDKVINVKLRHGGAWESRGSRHAIVSCVLSVWLIHFKTIHAYICLLSLSTRFLINLLLTGFVYVAQSFSYVF